MRAAASSMSSGVARPSAHDSEQKTRSPRCEHSAGPDPAGLDAEGHVGVQAQRLRRPRGVGDMARPVGESPSGGNVPVVEDGFADELDLHVAVDALCRPNEDVFGVVVGRRSSVGRHGVGSPSRSDGQRVPDDDPARWGLPRRHEDVGPGFVHPLGRDVDAERAEAERARFPVEQAAEHAR